MCRRRPRRTSSSREKHKRPLGDTILCSMRDIRVATVQFQHAAGDKGYNFGRIVHFVTEAARARVELMAFPEMCLTGYWHVRKLSGAAFEALAEPVPEGPSTRDLLDLSRKHGMTIGAGLLERAPDGGVYNAYVVAMPDGTWAVHRKLHVFEHPNICAGNAYTVFDTRSEEHTSELQSPYDLVCRLLLEK